jgi:hypothetical protein
MTKEEFIANRSAGEREGRSTFVWVVAMVFFGCFCFILWLVGFLSVLPFEKILPEDRTRLLVRSLLLLGFVMSVCGGILLGNRVWSLKRGFIYRSCRKHLDSEVVETGCCGRCGVRVFDL